MKLVALFLFLLITLFSNAQTKNPFDTLKFDKAMMFDFKGGEGIDLYIVDENGQLANSISNQIQLNQNQVKDLNNKLGNKNSYGGTTAACFDPHLGFVYYLKNEIVGHITICLVCNRLHSSLEIPAQKQGKVSVGTDTYYTGTGLSNSFQQFLYSLLQEYSFSHQP
ncbi:MAG: hypothetical protein ABIQ02_03865 [Saprospiraceae bacterium]